MKFHQNGPDEIARSLRAEGYQYQFVIHGDESWLGLFREVAAWYAETLEEGDRERMTIYGRATLFMDEEVAFQFKLRWV